MLRTPECIIRGIIETCMLFRLDSTGWKLGNSATGQHRNYANSMPSTESAQQVLPPNWDDPAPWRAIILLLLCVGVSQACRAAHLSMHRRRKIESEGVQASVRPLRASMNFGRPDRPLCPNTKASIILFPSRRRLRSLAILYFISRSVGWKVRVSTNFHFFPAQRFLFQFPCRISASINCGHQFRFGQYSFASWRASRSAVKLFFSDWLEINGYYLRNRNFFLDLRAQVVALVLFVDKIG